MFTDEKYSEIAAVKIIIISCLWILILPISIPAQPVVSIDFPENITPGEIHSIGIEIQKNGYSGKLSIRQLFPPGIIVNEQDFRSALFSFSEHELQLQWVELPDQEKFTVEYALFMPQIFNNRKEILSSYQYVFNDAYVNKDLPLIIMKIQTDSSLTSPTPQDITDVMDNSEHSVVYKIQVGAFSNEISEEELLKNLKLEQIEMTYFKHRGLHKYAIGNFGTKEEARKFKQERLGDLSDAFIVVFIDGERANLDEAIEQRKEESE